ncbi:MAG: FAD:protein FMN transferase [Oscillospiraceae bacterium]
MKHLTKKLKTPLIALLCLCLLSLSACGEAKPVKKQIFSMDTLMTLTAYGKNAEAGLSAAAGIINAMDAALDPENESSTVYALNSAKGEPVVVSGQIAEMLKTAATVSERSGGALDLAIYPLVKAWGFVDGSYTIPSDDAIAALLENIDFSGVSVTDFTESGDFLATVPSGGQLSFGAIAKGCASSYAVAAMRSAGVESAIISLGGNVQTLGKKPNGENWNVAVQDPNDTGSYVGMLSVGETAVITSGGYQRYFERDGVRYHHLLDPKTGRPADNGLLSVTIVCEDGTMADALSTALFVLGESAALDYWRDYGGFEAVLVTGDGRVVVTGGLYDVFEPYGDTYTYEYASK